MTTATETSANPFEQSLEYMRKSTQWGMSLQQEVLDHWAKLCSPTVPSQDDWTRRIQKFQNDWTSTITEIARKHRDVLDRQYHACIESLEESFRLASSKDPDEFRDRCGSLCRKMLDVMKETSESQMREFQDAMNKWVELCRTSP